MTGLLEMAAAADADADAGPVRVERQWTGSQVTYSLHTPAGEVPLSAEQFVALSETMEQQVRSQARYTVAAKRETNSPERFGLVRCATASATSDRDEEWIYTRPDADPSDPQLVFVKPMRDLDAEWELRLPLRTSRLAPPVSTAAWNDTAAVADLVRQATDPQGTWLLYTLTHPETVAEHRTEVAEADKYAARQAAEQESKRINRAAWSRLRSLASVPADTLWDVLRREHIGDNGPVLLRFEALPMRARVMTDPTLRDRVGFTAALVDTGSTEGYGDEDKASHPVVGWRMLLGTATGRDTSLRYLPEDDQRQIGSPWAGRVREALAPRGLAVVERPDGYWVIRDEPIFDLHHAAATAEEDPSDPSGPRNYDLPRTPYGRPWEAPRGHAARRRLIAIAKGFRRHQSRLPRRP